MTKSNIADALDGSFLDRLNGECQQVRDNHLSRLLAAAVGVGNAAYLDAALRFDPRVSSQALFQLMMAAEGPLADRARAAVLYLHGADQGLWKIARHNAEQARALVATNCGPADTEVKMKTETKPLKSPVRHNHVGRDVIGRHLAIMRECAVLEAVLTDPSASNMARLDAIETWFYTLGKIAPAELRAMWRKFDDRA